MDFRSHHAKVDGGPGLPKRSAEVVSKDVLFQEAWPGTHVTDDALTKCIGELRRVFHSAKGEPAIIETIAKRGYRVAVPVMWEVAEKTPSEASETVEVGGRRSAAECGPGSTGHGRTRATRFRSGQREGGRGLPGRYRVLIGC
jgi:DNA-binding winged helix-turn-helix (wHTH) protein